MFGADDKGESAGELGRNQCTELLDSKFFQRHGPGMGD